MRKIVVMTSVVLSLIGAAAPSVSAVDETTFNQNYNVSKGNRAFVKGDFQNASKHLNLALKAKLTKKTKVKTLNNLCAADFLQDKLDVAKQSCDAAIEMDRREWRARVNRGHIYRELGELDLARADYEAAQQLKPGEKISLKYLAKLNVPKLAASAK